VAITSAHPLANTDRTTTSAVTTTTASPTIEERLNVLFQNPYVSIPVVSVAGGLFGFSVGKLLPQPRLVEVIHKNYIPEQAPRPHDDEHRRRKKCFDCGDDKKDTTGEKTAEGKDTDETSETRVS